MTNEFFRSFKAIIIAIALTIITAIVGWIFVTNTLSLKKTPINISDTSFDWSSLKAGDHVVGDIQYSPGYFMYTQRSGGYEESRDYVITDYAKWDGEYSYYYMMSTKVYNGDFDRIYSEGYNSRSYQGRVITPGVEYELSYLECSCPKVKCGLRTNPEQCECSRQSILYILSQLEPASQFQVRIVNTILRGADRCTFRITRHTGENK